MLRTPKDRRVILKLVSTYTGPLGNKTIIQVQDDDGLYKVVFMKGIAVEVARMITTGYRQRGWRAIWGEWQKRSPGPKADKVTACARVYLTTERMSP